MDDLRREMIEAFDKGQAELGDIRGVRDRMLRGAYTGRRTRSDNRLPLAAGIAAILIAAVVIGTFVYVRAMSQPSPAGRINVPDSTPLILYHDPANVDQIDGVTWDGRTSGRLGFGGLNGTNSNPAGTLYGTSTGIRDRSGTSVLDMNGGFDGVWADDGRHYCFMFPMGFTDGGAPAILGLSQAGEGVSSIAQIGTYPAATANRPPPSIAACSVENDRAVLSQATGSSGLTVQDWVVQLSTGRILWTHTINVTGTTVAVGIVTSRDGQYVAESIALPAPASATIFGPDGSAITHLAATVDAFSWDGSLAVTSPISGAPVTLIRWRDGTVVWTGPAGLYFRSAKSEPGGTRVAIGLTGHSPADNLIGEQVRLVNLYVVSADGRLVWSKNNVNLS
jgi:hypothetical protein